MKRLIRYFSGRSVIKDISAYGYDFSMKKYILAITTGLLVIFGISMIYGLKPVCVIITGLVSISVIPGIIRKRYYNNNRLKKFMDVDIYLHQMAYSFMRNPKIYTALEDTGKIAGGTLGRVIEQDTAAALEFANCTAALTVSRMGAQPSLPSLNQVLLLLEQTGRSELKREVEGIRMHLECFLMTLTGGLKEYTGRSLKSRM